MGRKVKVEAGALESVVETLADCTELPEVAVDLDAAAVLELITELNACLPADRRVDLSKRADEPWRWLGGSHTARFGERLLLDLGVRHMQWVSYAEVTPDDRSVEQLIAERLAIIDAEGREEAQDATPQGVESWLRLPSPSVTFDLDAWLGKPASEERYEALCDELRLATVAALQACTTNTEWVYAVDEPEFVGGRCFRFWPHRAHEGMTWEVSPIPGGDDQVFVSHDFGWGLYSTWSFDESVDEALSVFGRPLIDAFQRLQPQASSRVIRVDGERV